MLTIRIGPTLVAACRTCGVIICVGGLVVLVGWAAQIERLIQIADGFAPMPINAALSFVLAGTALIAWATSLRVGAQRPSLIGTVCVDVAATLGLLTLAQYAFGIDFGIDTVFGEPFLGGHTAHPGRMSPLTAAAFTLAGTSFISGRLLHKTRQHWLVPVIGLQASAIGAIATTGLLAYALRIDPTLGAADASPLAIHTALFIGVLAVGVLSAALAAGRTVDTTLPRWIPVVPLIVGIAASVALHNALSVHDRLRLRDDTAAEANQVRDALDSQLRTRLNELARFANRQVTGPKLTRAAWEADAVLYLTHVQDVDAIEWLDHQLTVQWVQPRTGYGVEGSRYAADPSRARAAQAAMLTRSAALSETIHFAHRAPGFVAMIPAYRDDGDIAGFIAGLFRYDTLLESAIHTDGYGVRISAGSTILHETNTAAASTLAIAPTTHSTLPNVQWSVTLWPTESALAMKQSRLPVIILVAGLFVTLLLTALASVGHAAMTRADALGAAIADREQAQDAVRLSEERLRVAVHGSNAGIWDWNLVSGHLFLSDKFRDLLGYEPQDLDGNVESLMTLIHPDDVLGHQAAIKRHLKEGTVYQQELRIRAKSGEYRWYSARGEAVRDGSGYPTRFAGVLSDITDRKDAQQQLAAHARQVEQSRDTILVQTEQLKQQAAELAEARDRALAGTRAKSAFLASMSHEIRTPMNGVLGMTSLLLETQLTAEQREQVETVRVSADSLLTIINDILDYSKIEAGKLALESTTFDLRTVIEDSLDIVADAARRKGLALGCLIDPSISAQLVGDAGRLRQVLLNLLSNAVKFTEHGEVRVTVEPLERGPEGDCVRFAVTDTGVGISEETRSRLFEPFTQADESTARRYGGTGLGLTISKQLSELLGGTIGVDSAPGRGSTFWFTARFVLGAAGDEDTHAGVLENLPILVVDHEAISRAVLQAQLQHWGARVITVDNARRAFSDMRVASSRGAPFRLAFIDERLPDVDGAALFEWIRKSECAETPLILTSGVPQRGAVERAQQLGFATYVAKPFRQRALWNAVAAVTGRTATPSVAATPKISNVREHGTTTVLVADDNAVNQKVAAWMLEKLGCRVDIVADGAEALQMTAHVPYDVIFMDCQMPQMDGFEATARIRAREGHERRTPIVALTASAMQEDRDRCLDAGMDDHLPKPLTQAQLRVALERWVWIGDAALKRA
jgi:PAS domain S-box-containing protein